MTVEQKKIGLIVGSTRAGSNTRQIAAWLAQTVAQAPLSQGISLEVIDLAHSPNHPLPLEIDGVPQAHPKESLSMSYYDPRINNWSATVAAWDAVLIISPQYNWGIPAVLKNAIDHLYWEWKHKPVAIVTLGGHGGTKCAEALKTVLGGGLGMKVAETVVNVNLPRAYITGPEPVRPTDDFLKEYEEAVLKAVGELLESPLGQAVGAQK